MSRSELYHYTKEFRETPFAIYMDKLSKKDDKLISDLCNQGKSHHHVQESFYYIPMSEWDSLFQLINLLKNPVQRVWEPSPRYPTVLDVGAGTGRIVKMFKDNGIPAAGIEFHAPYVEIGRKAYGLSSEELVLKDAFTLDKKFLSGFNVIYTYMPLKNGSRMTELHFHLWLNAAPGTYFVEMYPRYYPMSCVRTMNLDSNKLYHFAYVRKSSSGNYLD